MLRLSVKETNDLVDEIERNGGNADSLRAAAKEVSNPGNSHTSIPTTNITDEEWLEEKRAQSTIEHGTDLECMVCHEKFDHLISGTCEVCWRAWMLSAKKPKLWSPWKRKLF